MAKSQYEKLGIESDKGHIKENFSGVNENIFPNAFVNIGRDPWQEGWVHTLHLDGSGSKSATHWLCFKETGEDGFLKYDVADAIAMGADVTAAGFTGPLVIGDVIDVNGWNIDKTTLIKNIAIGLQETVFLFENFGICLDDSQAKIKVCCMGGETADLIDQLTSWSTNVAVYSRMPKGEVIEGNVQPGDSIFGFSSGGRAIWESSLNSGKMSNGSTLADAVLFHAEYQKKYPFLRSEKNAFRGRFCVNEWVDSLGMTVGEALIGPTRQWAIVMKLIIDRLKEKGIFRNIHAIVMNTGGGMTKCGHVGRGIRYYKEAPLALPIFQLIQQEAGETWGNMLKSFNCGIGIEIIGDNAGGHLQTVLEEVSEKTQIKLYELGKAYKSRNGDRNEVVINYQGEEYGPDWS
jgi:phosphoribosylformylglycinamidine cyclo-ligase